MDPSLGVLRRASLWTMGALAFLVLGFFVEGLPDHTFSLIYRQSSSACLNLTVFICYLASRRHPWPPHDSALTPKELVTVVVLGVLAGYLTGIGYAAALSLAALLTLGYFALRSEEKTIRERYRGYFYIAVFLLLYPADINFIQRQTSHFVPYVYDLRAYQLDSVWGYQPSFTVMRLLHQCPIVEQCLDAIYEALAGVMFFGVIFGLFYSDKTYFDLLSALVSAGLAGLALYCIYPAIGTYFICDVQALPFPPDSNLAVVPGLPPLLWAAPGWTRNCCPSMHLSAALTLFFGLAPIGPRAKLATGLFVFATSLAALHLGGHYWGDYVVAFPITLGTLALFTPSNLSNAKVKTTCIVFGLSLSILLPLAQRCGHLLITSHRLSFLLVQLLVVATTVYLERELAQRSTQTPPDLSEVI